MTANFFDVTLTSSTEKEAIEYAMGFDWMSVVSENSTYPYLNYIDTINGVGIWYNYGCDVYYFSNENE